MTEPREQLLEQIRQQKPRWLDTHPTFSERIAAVADFPDVPLPDEDTPAIDLLDDPGAVEAELTTMLTEYVHQRSSTAGAPAAAAAGEDG
jgi:hypothetical protein